MPSFASPLNNSGTIPTKAEFDELAEYASGLETRIAQLDSQLETYRSELLAKVNSSIAGVSVSGNAVTFTRGNGTSFSISTQDTDTKYTAGTGLSLDGTAFSLKSYDYGDEVALDAQKDSGGSSSYHATKVRPSFHFVVPVGNRYMRVLGGCFKLWTADKKNVKPSSMVGEATYARWNMFDSVPMVQVTPWREPSSVDSSGTITEGNAPLGCMVVDNLVYETSGSDKRMATQFGFFNTMANPYTTGWKTNYVAFNFLAIGPTSKPSVHGWKVQCKAGTGVYAATAG